MAMFMIKPWYKKDIAGIYSAKWTVGSNSAWVREDDAARFNNPVPQRKSGSTWTSGSSIFDDIMPWAGMRVLNVPGVGDVVEIPKYWYKWGRSTTDYMKLSITTNESIIDNFWKVSPAHGNRSDGVGERDYVYVGKYHCANDYTSKTGFAPLTNTTRSTFRTNIHNLGTYVWQWDYAMYWTVMMLYLVEYANWNTQEKIGYGCSDSGSKQNNGLTDSMTYHTGTSTSSITTYGHVKYRNIEDLWANVYDYVDGVYCTSTAIYGIYYPSSFSDSSGGTKIANNRLAISGYTKSFTYPGTGTYAYAIFPQTADSSLSGSTYACDYAWANAINAAVFVGGDYNRNLTNGGFMISTNTSASDSYPNVGSRLMILPPSRLSA